MKRLVILWMFFVFAFSFSCKKDSSSTKKRGKILVVVSIIPQEYIVKRIGGNKVDVYVMVSKGKSPHLYEPTPRDMIMVSKGDIYFKVGSGIEFEKIWWGRIKETNPELFVVNGSRGISLNNDDTHVWLGIDSYKKMGENFFNGIVKYDPKNASFYKKGFKKFTEDMDSLIKYARSVFSRFSKRVFMIYHPFLGYLASQFDLKQIAIENKGKKPSLKRIKECIGYIKKYDLNYIYMSKYRNEKFVEPIVSETKVRVLKIDPLPENYISSMKDTIDKLAMEFE